MSSDHIGVGEAAVLVVAGGIVAAICAASVSVYLIKLLTWDVAADVIYLNRRRKLRRLAWGKEHSRPVK